MAGSATVHAPYADRRRRTAELLERYPHAREVLGLQEALIDAHERAFWLARAQRPAPEALTAWLVENVLPWVVDATLAAGPERLRQAVVGRVHSANLADVFGRWLGGQEQSPVDRYLARACVEPVLLALGPDMAGAVCRPAPAGGRRCPHCGGLPQLSFIGLSGEALVTAPRQLQCSRCAGTWSYARMTCAACGEVATSRLPIFEEVERFPHVRIEGCETCRRYLLSIDLRRDASAVPLVDELAMVPLDLFAKDRGMAKLMPNLMGF